MFDINKVYDVLCGVSAISNYAYDIHYSSKGSFFYSDHLFSERLGDVDEFSEIKDDIIETMYLGRGIEAPLSKDISETVADITPEVTEDTLLNFKYLRQLIVETLVSIEQLDDLTRGEEDLIGTLAHILQRHNGLLFNQLVYSEEEETLNNDKWITVKPHGEEEKGRPLFLKTGETPKQAMKRQWGVDLDRKKKEKSEKEKADKDEPKKDDDSKSDNLSKMSDSEIEQKKESVYQKIREIDLDIMKSVQEESKYKELKVAYQKAEDDYYEISYDDYEKKNKLAGEMYKAKEDFDNYFYKRVDEERESRKDEIEALEKEREKYSSEISKRRIEEFKRRRKEEEEKAEKRKESIKQYYAPKSIAGVSKGSPMSREKANGGNVNPKYSEGGGYRINCQSCVVVYEARLRGYNVEVLPNTKGSKLEELSRKAYDVWLDLNTGDVAVPDVINVSSVNSLYDKLDSLVEKDGRYEFRMAWKKCRTGHVVTMSRDDKGLYLYDPQTGKTYYGEEMKSAYLRSVSLKGREGRKPWIMRIDDKAFNPDYYDAIMKKSD